MDCVLREGIEPSALHGLLERFSRLAGVPLALLDAAGNLLAGDGALADARGRSVPVLLEAEDIAEVVAGGQPGEAAFAAMGCLAEALETLARTGRERLRAERELREARERAERLRHESWYNRALIEACTDCIAVVDLYGVIFDANRTNEAVSGYSLEELRGTRLTDYLRHPEEMMESLQRMRDAGVVSNLELNLRHKDGHYVPMLFDGSVFTDEAGRPAGVVACGRDITARKRTEEELSKREQYELLAKNSTDVITRITVNGVYSYVSPAAAKLLGYQPEEMVGHNVTRFYHPADIGMFQSLLRRINARHDGDYTFCYRFRRKDGVYLWLETSGKAIYQPDTGELIEFQSSNRDVSDRKRAEDELQEAKDYAEEIIQAANACCIILDEAGTVLNCNRAAEELIGYTREEMIGRCWFDFGVPRDRFPEVSRRFFAGGFPKKQENPVLTKSGEVRYIAWQNSVLARSGQPAVTVGFGLDITERREMEERLRAYRERLGMVLRNIDAIIFQLDAGSRFLLSVGRGLQRINLSEDRVIGQRAEEVFNGDAAVLEALSRAQQGSTAAVALSVGEAVFDVVFSPLVGKTGERGGVIGLAVDVTAKTTAQRDLHAEKERLRVTLQSIGDGVIATDAEGRITLMNGVAEELTGWRQAEAAGQPFSEVYRIVHEETGEAAVNPVERVLATGGAAALENHTVLLARDGARRNISESAAPIVEARRVLGVVLVFRDVTEAKKREREIVYLSYHDQLTGLYNRTFFEEEARRLDTPRQTPLSVIMGDVNGLKLTNDVFGHGAGDGLLRQIAGVLRHSCREEDIIARVGGDEFCILLPNTPADQASEICRRISAACSQGDEKTRLSISLGFATKTRKSQTVAGIVKAAEDSMYRRKLLESRSQHSFLISSIRTTLFEKSFETEQHAERLIALSRAVGEAMRLPDDKMNDLELFAMLHDIGKIAVDSHILTKPDKLTEDEWVEMRRHPEIGFRIALASPDLSPIADCILFHHERWDGRGYPQGARGRAIPLLARILSIVDAYDAMTQDRVYRPAMSREEALWEIARNSGTQFDPEIAAVFLKIMGKEKPGGQGASGGNS